MNPHILLMKRPTSSTGFALCGLLLLTIHELLNGFILNAMQSKQKNTFPLNIELDANAFAAHIAFWIPIIFQTKGRINAE